MHVIEQVPFAAVVQAWLKGEWYDSFFDPVRNYIPQSVIDDKDFDDEQRCKTRYWLLRTTRFPIVDPLPQDAIWYSTTYEIADADRTFIVPSNDWGQVTGSQYRPAAVLPNLNGNDPHAIKIRDMKAVLPSVDRRLVLVASDMNSVLTIIEGNHRSVAILADAIENGSPPQPLIEQVFVGVSANMRNYPWHIERFVRPDLITSLSVTR
jgi:hypothetical protein